MKTRILLLAALAVVFCLGVLAAESDAPKPLELALKDINGVAFNLADYRGQVVVVDVWATWCGYCVREMPDLAACLREAEEANAPLQILGLSVDAAAQQPAVTKLVKKMEIPYPIVMADKTNLKPFGKITSIPAKFLIDKHGVLVDKRVGALDRDKLEAWVKPYLEEEYTEPDKTE